MKLKWSWLLRAAVLAALCPVSSAFADNLPLPKLFVLSWAAPIRNDDGSPLTDIVGYYIYDGASADSLQPHYFASVTRPWIVLAYPPGGTHYFAVSAVNADGIESTLTPVVNDTML